MTKHNENSEFKPEHKTYWIHKLSGGLPNFKSFWCKVHPNVKSKKGYAFARFFRNQRLKYYMFLSQMKERTCLPVFWLLGIFYFLDLYILNNVINRI